ncbi:MAG TPA: T9SS type A sorting domain-containing protein [Chitinophagales bacterium]|nr:T9SS type A sorting domain-containing protein [Chitinophagales bacterium]
MWLLLLIFISHFSFAQNPLVKEWDYRFGGMEDDYLPVFQQTKDGGYILGGQSYSGIGGDKTQINWGHADYWIVKLDSFGNYEWDKDFGGSDYDFLSTIDQSKDGGYIIGGESWSGVGGDKTEPNWGISDYWIVKIDSLGNYEWDKDFGGTDGDFPTAIKQTFDGGYIIFGTSQSNISGNKTETAWGNWDYWIVKIDSLGNFEWDKDFGTISMDESREILQTNEGGYIFIGDTDYGISGDKTKPLWGTNDIDYWIIKTDSLGNYEWDEDIGGTRPDIPTTVTKTKDGGYIFGGETCSGLSGNKTQVNRDTTGFTADYWIIKFDSLWNIQWDKDFGGTSGDGLFSIQQTHDDGYLLGGFSYSDSSGDKTENNLGYAQPWIIKIDSLGNKQWDKTIFASDFTIRGLAIQTNGGCYTIGNWTTAGIGGEKTQPAWVDSTYDFWIVKFCDTTGLYQHLPQSAFNSNAISGCPGSCFDFTNASLNATTYQWFFTGGNPASSTQQNPSNICYANTGMYDVTLIASSNFASDTLLQAAYITIFTPLAVSISQNGNLLTCNPAAASYQWSLNGNQIPGATSQTLFINQTGTFTIEVIDVNGCISSDTLVVNTIPSPNFSTIDTTLCEKFCTDFFDQSTNNPTAWQWIFSGGDPAFSSEQNPVNICYDVPGVYDVTLITTNANGSDTLTLHNYITVYPTPPIPTITQVGYTLTSSAATSYQWQLNAVDIPGATNQSYAILQTGYYTVVVGDTNSCKNSATTYVLISGVNDVSGDGGISIYPNPSSGNFTIELLQSENCGEVSIEVVNMLGQKVFSSREKISSSNWKKEIDLHDTASGVYFIEIKSQNIFLRKKIIVSH